MKRLNLIIIILVLSACGSPDTNKETVQESTSELAKDMIGKWVNTTLFDSTLQQQRIAPWINQFYGHLLIEIRDNQSVQIEGNMDGSDSPIKIIDSNSFTITGRTDKLKVEFDRDRKMLTLTTNHQSYLFRPIKNTDKIEIIGDEQAFNNFFKSKLFSNYSLDIEYLWTGFETYQPFDFDALGVKTDSSKLEMYAWEMIGDTLMLYQTTKSTDQESGFTFYKRGKLMFAKSAVGTVFW